MYVVIFRYIELCEKKFDSWQQNQRTVLQFDCLPCKSRTNVSPALLTLFCPWCITMEIGNTEPTLFGERDVNHLLAQTIEYSSTSNKHWIRGNWIKNKCKKKKHWNFKKFTYVICILFLVHVAMKLFFCFMKNYNKNFYFLYWKLWRNYFRNFLTNFLSFIKISF